MNQPRQEKMIRGLVDAWVQAICDGDMERVLADRSQDIVMYDVPEPAQHSGIDAYRETWELFFRHNPAGPARFQVNDLQVAAGEEVAFAYGLLQIGGGDAHCRLTLGFERVDGRWIVTHEHHSMPVT